MQPGSTKGLRIPVQPTQTDRLARHPEWVATLARWHFDQWGLLTGTDTVEQYRFVLEEYSRGATIPCVLVAFAAEDLLGSVSLVPCDMEIRADRTPWLAQLFVAPSHRRQGTGAALVNAALSHARQCGFQHLHLYTSGSLPDFYERLGWVIDERVSYLGKERTIMHYDLVPEAENPSSSLCLPSRGPG